MEAPLLLAISALSALLKFTSFDSRIIMTLYPRSSRIRLSFWDTESVSLYSGSFVLIPSAPAATLAFIVDEPGPIGSFSEFPLA